MSTLVFLLRTVSLFAFAGPMLLMASRRRGKPQTQVSQEGGDRAPLVANLAAFGFFFPSLLIFLATRKLPWRYRWHSQGALSPANCAQDE